MTWWPSVLTSAVMAPTIAGSSSTTRMRRVRLGFIGGPSDRRRGRQGDDEPRPGRLRRLAPEAATHRFDDPPRGVEPDTGPPGGVRVAPRVRLEDPVPPFDRASRSNGGTG